MNAPRTDAGRALLLLAAYDGIALVAADSLRERILAIEAEAEAERSAGAAPLDVERLAKALNHVERSTDVGWPNMDERDLARLILARLAERTDR